MCYGYGEKGKGACQCIQHSALGCEDVFRTLPIELLTIHRSLVPTPCTMSPEQVEAHGPIPGT